MEKFIFILLRLFVFVKSGNVSSLNSTCCLVCSNSNNEECKTYGEMLICNEKELCYIQHDGSLSHISKGCKTRDECPPLNQVKCDDKMKTCVQCCEGNGCNVNMGNKFGTHTPVASWTFNSTNGGKDLSPNGENPVTMTNVIYGPGPNNEPGGSVVLPRPFNQSMVVFNPTDRLKFHKTMTFFTRVYLTGQMGVLFEYNTGLGETEGKHGSELWLWSNNTSLYVHGTGKLLRGASANIVEHDRWIDITIVWHMLSLMFYVDGELMKTYRGFSNLRLTHRGHLHFGYPPGISEYFLSGRMACAKFFDVDLEAGEVKSLTCDGDAPTTITKPCNSVTSQYSAVTTPKPDGVCILEQIQGGTNTPTKLGYKTFGCSTSIISDHEVHVLSVYEPVGGVRKFQALPDKIGEMQVNISQREGKVLKPIRLVLTSYEAVRWYIKTPEELKITSVFLASHYETNSTVFVNDQQLTAPTLTTSHKYYFFGHEAIASGLLDTVTEMYGYVTSYTSVFTTEWFKLDVGVDDPDIPFSSAHKPVASWTFTQSNNGKDLSPNGENPVTMTNVNYARGPNNETNGAVILPQSFNESIVVMKPTTKLRFNKTMTYFTRVYLTGNTGWLFEYNSGLGERDGRIPLGSRLSVMQGGASLSVGQTGKGFKVPTPDILQLDKWIDVVVVWETSLLSFYVNGSLVYYTPGRTKFRTRRGHLHFGYRPGQTNPYPPGWYNDWQIYFLSGRMACSKFYNVALSTEEVQHLTCG